MASGDGSSAASKTGTTVSPTGSVTAGLRYLRELPVRKGRSFIVRLREGLDLGVLNNVYPQGMVYDGVMEPGLTIYLCFGESADLDVSVGGRSLPIGRHRGAGTRPFGFALWRERTAPYRRRAPSGAWTTAIMVWLSPAWFEQTFQRPNTMLPPSAREHLAISRWFPSRRMLLLAASLFDPEASRSSVSRLRDEIITLELVSEVLATVRPPSAREEGRRIDMLLLNKACDLIETELAGELLVEAIASEVGVGIATLRRLFRTGFNCTISEYIQARRLDAARTILENGGAVSAAAALAGYTSPANFATAFRRRFGITPRRARAGDMEPGS
jgi:AraC-like DNA-binding protein